MCLCDNPEGINFHMRLLCFALAWMCVSLLAGIFAWPQATSPIPPNPGSVPLVLAGGTVVDVTDWGYSVKDLQDAIVIVRDGRIAEVGSRAIPIPKGAQIIDCTGKYVIPGLIDGFTGLNSQGQANAYLYMGVTTVVASSDNRRGHIYMGANPSPHIYLLDSVGSNPDNPNSLIGYATRLTANDEWRSSR